MEEEILKLKIWENKLWNKLEEKDAWINGKNDEKQNKSI